MSKSLGKNINVEKRMPNNPISGRQLQSIIEGLIIGPESRVEVKLIDIRMKD